MLHSMNHRALLTILFISAACESSPDEQTLRSIASDLAVHCPLVSPDDEAARDACADGLARSTVIADAMREVIDWGGFDSSVGDGYAPEDQSLTRFDTFVFRRLYLSAFMFTGEGFWKKHGDVTTLHAPAVFRNRMSAGSYPYPFWHSKEKWDAYQATTQVIFVFRGPTIVAGYRAGEDASRRTVDRGTFDGQWRWFDELGEEQPRVALFSYLLSPENPHLAALDRVFRTLEGEARSSSCESCHAPDNITRMNPLVILNLPNQALVARHELLEVLSENSMPPEVGLDEETRRTLAELAEGFAQMGDRALEYEAGVASARR